MVMAYKSISIPEAIAKALAFLGKHSMNIFLFHAFIFYMWFSDIIYATRNPLTIFLELLTVCLLISVVLERIKNMVKFEALIGKIQNIDITKIIKHT